jgi:Spy/CpxP family protein refolding chaperone
VTENETNSNSASTDPNSSRPNRRMPRRRKIILGTVLAVVATMVVAPMAFAGSRWGKKCNITPDEMKDRADHVLDRAMNKLDGTDEQRTAIDRVVDEMIPEVVKWRTEGRALKQELKDILLAETIDRAALETVRKKGLAMADRVSADAFDALADVAETLTAAQRDEIAEFASKRGGCR